MALPHRSPPHFLPVQVAGCGKDLSFLKDYHQRYRVCEVHIKLTQVLKGRRGGANGGEGYASLKAHML